MFFSILHGIINCIHVFIYLWKFKLFSSNLLTINENVNPPEMSKSFLYRFSNGLRLKMNKSNTFVIWRQKRRKRDYTRAKIFNQIFVNISIVCIRIHLNQLKTIQKLTGVESNINHVSTSGMKYCWCKAEGNIFIYSKGSNIINVGRKQSQYVNCWPFVYIELHSENTTEYNNAI